MQNSLKLVRNTFSRLPWVRRSRVQTLMPHAGRIGIGLAVGAAAMYFMDPQRGRRRRALVRDQLNHTAHVVGDGSRLVAQDMSNRAVGVWAQLRGLLRNRQADDGTVLKRVRAKLGRVVSHPHAVQVSVRDGAVTLSGPILAREVSPLLTMVHRVPGARDVSHSLTVYEEPGNVSALQGGRVREGGHFAFMQSNWSPTARLAGGMAAAGLVGAALRTHSPFNIALMAVGALLFARAASNRELKSLVGVGAQCRGMDAYKTINIDAPVDAVFALWANFENFPLFMSNVREVRVLDERRSRWTVAGPAGVPMSFDSEVTAVIPNELIEWRSVETAKVKHWGSVRFKSNADGGTQVTVWMCYVPLAGALGHVVARTFGADPESRMDQDLMRMKQTIETGTPPRDAAAYRQMAAQSTSEAGASMQ